MRFQTPPASELSRREMMALGDRLLSAMKAEDDLDQANLQGNLPVVQQQWIEQRRTVDQLAQQYAEAVQRWTRALRENQDRQPASAADHRTRFARLHRLVSW